MKEVGRFNVTREQLDAIFAEGHNGIAINTMVGKQINVAGFVIYDMEEEGNAKQVKLIDDSGRDYYTGSQVFIKNLILYLQTKNDEDFPVSITVKESESKKGRKYLTIEEAVGSSGNNDGWRSMKF